MRINASSHHESAQQQDSVPLAPALDAAREESGVAVMRYRFAGGKTCSSTASKHRMYFSLTQPTFIACRIAGEILDHEAEKGWIGICPAHADCICTVEGEVNSLIVTVDPSTLSLVAAEEEALGAELIPLVGGDEFVLLHQARVLAAECRAGFPNGPLYWHEASSNFMTSILARHSIRTIPPTRGRLGKDALTKLRDYINANLGDPISVTNLASIVGRSPFHFTRVFKRSVGVTPHQYLIHLRLRRVLELVRDGRGTFAEIAAITGFADQSHLSRWVRRVHGVSLRELAAQAVAARACPGRHRP
jgi:AraC family transcriptional regulator